MKNIDTTIWITQQALADELSLPIQNVHNWVQRDKIDHMEYEFLPGQKIVLVNKTTIRINYQHHKSRQ